MQCYIVQTGSYLPGPAISNHQIMDFLGAIPGESAVSERVLRANGIRTRHYAQDPEQNSTDDVYGLAAKAATKALETLSSDQPSLLMAGTTFSPLAAPGIASIVHDRLSNCGLLNWPVEISSHSGVCCSSAAAFINAIRTIQLGQHRSGIVIGAEHASEILKSSRIQLPKDRDQHDDVRESQWFMSVFLRFMLSDGAGACVLRNEPIPNQLNFKINWARSVSLAHEAPLCMQLDNANRLLTQDIRVLTKYLVPSAESALRQVLATEADELSSYSTVLPHLSSHFFFRRMKQVIDRNAQPKCPRIWTNLSSAGNTGAASIFIMLDEFLRTQPITQDERILLFVPESGQFQFAFISLTAIPGE